MELTEQLLLQLGQAFPGLALYRERPEKETAEPGFFAEQTGEEQKRMPGGRIRIHSAFDIQYLPGTGGETACREIAGTLFSVLEVLGDTIRGTAQGWSVTEGVLHFLMEYRFFGREVVEKTWMEELEARTRIGG